MKITVVNNTNYDPTNKVADLKVDYENLNQTHKELTLKYTPNTLLKSCLIFAAAGLLPSGTIYADGTRNLKFKKVAIFDRGNIKNRILYSDDFLRKQFGFGNELNGDLTIGSVLPRFPFDVNKFLYETSNNIDESLLDKLISHENFIVTLTIKKVKLPGQNIPISSTDSIEFVSAMYNISGQPTVIPDTNQDIIEEMNSIKEKLNELDKLNINSIFYQILLGIVSSLFANLLLLLFQKKNSKKSIALKKKKVFFPPIPKNVYKGDKEKKDEFSERNKLELLNSEIEIDKVERLHNININTSKQFDSLLRNIKEFKYKRFRIPAPRPSAKEQSQDYKDAVKRVKLIKEETFKLLVRIENHSLLQYSNALQKAKMMHEFNEICEDYEKLLKKIS